MVILIAILIFSVVLHEVAHGYAADMLGDSTARYQGRLTLNPISHLDPIGSVLIPTLTYLGGGFIIGWAKPVPYNPYNISNKYGEAIVAAAGPATNFVIAVLAGLFIQFGGFGETTLMFLTQVALINVVLGVFNLIPIPPLDGSKILFQFLPYRFQEWRHSLERYGFFLVLIFIFILWEPVVQPIVFTLLRFIVGL